MRIVLIGTVVFSREMLLHLLAGTEQVVGVCTASSAAQNADYVDLQPLCEAHGVDIHHTADINSEVTIGWITRRQPDVIFCFGWSRLIGMALLALPPLGVVGYHPAALPANRGRHPLIWALALGLRETASTFFIMDEGADSGDIVSQAAVAIADDDDAGVLYGKIVSTGRGQLDVLVPALATGAAARRKQDHQQANYWRKRTVADGQIDWRMPASGICNLVRALARPYPGAHIQTLGGPVKVWKARLVEDIAPNSEPGKVLSCEAGQAVVRCGVHAIRLLETEPSFLPEAGAYL
jgi:methionyl-tRNA formyltransferase